jgi:hypothetical protein
MRFSIERATTGGLLRDCTRYFSYNIGICSIPRAELLGILIGSHLTWEKDFRTVMVDSDSAVQY